MLLITLIKKSVRLTGWVLLLGLTACSGISQNKQLTTQGYRHFNVLAVNDVYNIEGTDARQSGGMARLRTLRRQLSTADQQVLLLHAGDFLFPSSMSSQFKGEQMIDVMNQLDGDENAFDDRLYVTFGNHEFDKGAMKYAQMINQRITESDFYWLGSNVNLTGAAAGNAEGFKKSSLTQALTTINGVRVGLYSITTNIAIPEYATIDNDYLKVSKRHVKALRAQGAEVVIAVTHLRMDEDQQLLEQLGSEGPDVVFGGHEHNRQYVCVGKRCVIKADADIRSATIASISVSPAGEVDVSHRYTLIKDSTIEADTKVEQRTAYWIDRYERKYCSDNQQPAGCLTKVIGKTAVELVGEELEIRRFETNLGTYVADQMRLAFDEVKLPGDKKVQIALVNSGSLRLNQNIPAGAELNQWYINGIFQYPAKLRVIEISGKTLKAVVDHQIEEWSGVGWWLQSSGIVFRHDVAAQRVTDLSLVDADGQLTAVQDDDKIVAVVNNYISNPAARGDQDGYDMLNLDNELVYGDKLIDLKAFIIEQIDKAHQAGQAINPKLPGRVCNSTRPDSFCVLD